MKKHHSCPEPGAWCAPSRKGSSIDRPQSSPPNLDFSNEKELKKALSCHECRSRPVSAKTDSFSEISTTSPTISKSHNAHTSTSRIPSSFIRGSKCTPSPKSACPIFQKHSREDSTTLFDGRNLRSNILETRVGSSGRNCTKSSDIPSSRHRCCGTTNYSRVPKSVSKPLKEVSTCRKCCVPVSNVVKHKCCSGKRTGLLKDCDWTTLCKKSTEEPRTYDPNYSRHGCSASKPKEKSCTCTKCCHYFSRVIKNKCYNETKNCRHKDCGRISMSKKWTKQPRSCCLSHDRRGCSCTRKASSNTVSCHCNCKSGRDVTCNHVSHRSCTASLKVRVRVSF